MRDLTINFPQPDKQLNLNERLHFRPKAARVAAWRKAAWAAAHNARSHPSWPREALPFCLVQVSLPVRSTLVKRDPSNWIATVKPIVDGLTDAAVWPDDDSRYVRIEEPTFHPDDGLVWVRIYPVEET